MLLGFFSSIYAPALASTTRVCLLGAPWRGVFARGGNTPPLLRPRGPGSGAPLLHVQKPDFSAPFLQLSVCLRILHDWKGRFRFGASWPALARLVAFVLVSLDAPHVMRLGAFSGGLASGHRQTGFWYKRKEINNFFKSRRRQG